MNWKLGIFGGWLLLSAAWITYSVWQYWTKCSIDEDGTIWCSNYTAPVSVRHIAATIVIPPIAGLLVWVASVWMANGFGVKSH